MRILILSLTLLLPFSVFAADPAAKSPDNQGDEQPLELYIISWPDPEPVLKDTPPVSFLIEAPEPVDPEVFRREIHYHDVLNRN